MSGASDSHDSFSGEDLEIVFESLCDLFADSAFIPSLFISFDCAPAKSDVVQPLLRYLCRCCRVVLNSGGDELGAHRELGVLAVQVRFSLHSLFRNEHRNVTPNFNLMRIYFISRRCPNLLNERALL